MRAPSLLGLGVQWFAAVEALALIPNAPKLLRQPTGNGARVYVLPGIFTGDYATKVLRVYLSRLGYEVSGWGLGVNRGQVRQALRQLIARIEQDRAPGQKVHLIGWSLGGVIARELARERPDLVKQVIMLGSPLVGGPKYTTVGRLYRLQGKDVDVMAERSTARNTIPLQCPLTSVYSKFDGIVHWEASIDPMATTAEYVEVRATHTGLGVSPRVFTVVAQKLYAVERGELG